MLAKITKQAPVTGFLQGYLYVSKLNGAVVLCTKDSAPGDRTFEGTVIVEASLNFKGVHGTNWATGAFDMFLGEIVLSQEH